MKKIIENLYQIQEREGECFLEQWEESETEKQEAERESWRIYFYFFEYLPEEEKKLFLRYVQLRETRKNQEIKDAYHRGFKTEI